MAGKKEKPLILIVDDSDDDYDIMKMALKTNKFDLENHRRCSDGQEALDYLLHRGQYAEPASAPTPSLILLDLNMPGLDGRETLRIIKSTAETRNIPVIVMTNSDNDQDIDYCYTQGANSYVRKSLDWSGYVKVIGATLAFWVGAAMAPAQAEAASALNFAPAAVMQVSFESALNEAEMVHPPKGFSQMCERRPELCPAESVQGDVAGVTNNLARLFGQDALSLDVPELTKKRLDTLNRVNLAVNASIRPKNDDGQDSWDLGKSTGDCEDYVLMKRELLAKLGWPRSALRITVVHDGTGYHAVLLATTQQGEFVLDNMSAELTSVQDSPYEFVVAQSIKNSGAWVRVSKG